MGEDRVCKYNFAFQDDWKNSTYREFDQKTGFIDEFDENIVKTDNASCHLDIRS